jgi:hypothetical protein
MIFADLVAGDVVFVDANTLVYHFGPHAAFGAACQQLVQRIENQEIRGLSWPVRGLLGGRTAPAVLFVSVAWSAGAWMPPRGLDAPAVGSFLAGL